MILQRFRLIRNIIGGSRMINRFVPVYQYTNVWVYSSNTNEINIEDLVSNDDNERMNTDDTDDDDINEDRKIDNNDDEYSDTDGDDEIESKELYKIMDTTQKVPSKLSDFSSSLMPNNLHKKFEEFGLVKRLENALVNIHDYKPFKIQSLTYSMVNNMMNDGNINGGHKITSSIIESGIGSGKTLAYLLPALNDTAKVNKSGSIIIIVPNSELSIQIKSMIKGYLNITGNNEFKEYIKKKYDFSDITIYSDANPNISMDYHMDYIKLYKPNIIIGQPKFIRLLLLNKIIDSNKIDYLIFDEFDSLFTIQTYKHEIKKKKKRKPSHTHIKPCELILQGIIKNEGINNNLDKKLHIMFVSSTIPTVLKNYIKQLLNPYPIQIVSSFLLENNIDKSIKFLSASIKHQYIVVDDENTKMLYLANIINSIFGENDQPPGVLTFISNEVSSVKFGEKLCQYDIKVGLLHEYLKDRKTRTKFLSLFKKGKIQCGIATMNIGRGMDLLWLNNVILYHVPKHVSTYLHLAGRVGRLGNKGYVTSIVTSDELGILEKYANKLDIELRELDVLNYGDILNKQTKKCKEIKKEILYLKEQERNKMIEGKTLREVSNTINLDNLYGNKLWKYDHDTL